MTKEEEFKKNEKVALVEVGRLNRLEPMWHCPFTHTVCDVKCLCFVPAEVQRDGIKFSVIDKRCRNF